MKKTTLLVALVIVAACAFAQQPEQVPQEQAAPQKQIKQHGFQFNLDIEGNATKNSGGIGFSGGLGYRMGRAFYLGAGVSPTGEFGREEGFTISNWTLPIYGDARIYIPTKRRCFPYLDLGLGGFFGLGGKVQISNENVSISTSTQFDKGGMYLQAGLGFEFRYLNFGAGYKMYYYEDKTMVNYGFVRVGISLGAPNRKP